MIHPVFGRSRALPLPASSDPLPAHCQHPPPVPSDPPAALPLARRCRPSALTLSKGCADPRLGQRHNKPSSLTGVPPVRFAAPRAMHEAMRGKSIDHREGQ